MKISLKFLLLLIHLLISGIMLDYIGDHISQPINLGFVIFGGLIYSLIMISIIIHTYQFILSLKKQIKP